MIQFFKSVFAVIFHVHSGHTFWQEARDQTLHFAYAGGLWVAIYFPIPAWGAGLLSFFLGFLRELEQHSWNWREVGRQDLFYWALGSLSLTLASYAIG